MSSVRIPLTKLGALAACVLLLAACTAGPSAATTGETTEVTVTVQGMRYFPDVIEVPVGNELIVTFENTSTDMHDLVFASGVSSQRVAPGASETLNVGVISADLDGWCSVSNHRAQGMVLTVKAVD